MANQALLRIASSGYYECRGLDEFRYPPPPQQLGALIYLI